MDHFYPLRLPAYRSSYLNRFHPYPRCKRPLDHMSIDRQPLVYEEIEAALLGLRDVTTLQFQSRGSDTSPLLRALSSHEQDEAGSSLRGGKQESFTNLVVDLALTIRRARERTQALSTAPTSCSPSTNTPLK